MEIINQIDNKVSDDVRFITNEDYKFVFNSIKSLTSLKKKDNDKIIVAHKKCCKNLEKISTSELFKNANVYDCDNLCCNLDDGLLNPSKNVLAGKYCTSSAIIIPQGLFLIYCKVSELFLLLLSSILSEVDNIFYVVIIIIASSFID
jgi:hypothetical protein